MLCNLCKCISSGRGTPVSPNLPMVMISNQKVNFYPLTGGDSTIPLPVYRGSTCMKFCRLISKQNKDLFAEDDEMDLTASVVRFWTGGGEEPSKIMKKSLANIKILIRLWHAYVRHASHFLNLVYEDKMVKKFVDSLLNIFWR